MRNINVISGLLCTGKSHYLRQCRDWPEFTSAVSIEFDALARRYWGERALSMTRMEKIYRNQVTREEIQRSLIIDGAKTVLLEMVMLTRKNHQKPFVKMVEQTADYLRQIESEKVGGRQPDNASINLNVVLFYCPLKLVRDRIERRSRDPGNSTIWNTMEGVLDTAAQFEMPTAYEPLPINTTDESPEAEQQRLKELRDFFLKGEKPSQDVIEARLREARGFLDELKQEARNRGIVY